MVRLGLRLWQLLVSALARAFKLHQPDEPRWLAFAGAFEIWAS